MSKFLFVLLSLSILAACGDDDSTPDSSTDAGGDATTDATPEAGSGSEFKCEYENTFSNSTDCKEYTGTGWTQTLAEADCAAVFLGTAGVLGSGQCSSENSVGKCVTDPGDGKGAGVVSYGGAGACGATQSACENFSGGTFEPSDICASGCEPSDEIGTPFTPYFLNCIDPLDDVPGQSAGGQVCTETIIAGSTEEGRRYADYADCDVVRTQRPYYGQAPTTDPTPSDDPRLNDAAYMGEVAWLKEQAEASACACCHTTTDTPSGAAVWDTEIGPIWTDTLTNEALAMLAGLTDSKAFGFLQPEENNGFDRTETGLPTTDRARLDAFMAQELTRRGLTAQQASQLEPFGPIFQELIDFVPEACPEGVGVDAEGNLLWTGGGARQVYILEADSKSPGVPPNWDLPAGTIWAIAADHTKTQMGCGMAYGTVPEGALQRFPADDAAPAALVSGTDYYLHVLADIALPVMRCTFTAP